MAKQRGFTQEDLDKMEARGLKIIDHRASQNTPKGNNILERFDKKPPKFVNHLTPPKIRAVDVLTSISNPDYFGIRLHIDKLPPGLNVMLSIGFIERHRVKKWWRAKMKEYNEHGEFSHRSHLPCRIELNRQYKRNPLDIDNLCGSVKYPLDAIRFAGIIKNDDPTIVTEIICKQEKVKFPQTVITIHWDKKIVE